jgi:hypothetical protein
VKKRIALFAVALLLRGALAQEAATTPTVEIRLSIVESRLGRLESDVSRLSSVPTQLARIEEKVTALTERTGNNSSVLQTVGLGVVMSVLTGWISYSMGKKSK